MKKPLYQIQQEYIVIATALEDDELTPELETALAISEQELQVKAIGYGHIILEAESNIDTIDAEIKRLTALKKSEVNKRDRLKESISSAMMHFGIEKIETPLMKMSFRTSKATVGMSFESLPDAYLTIVPETRKPNLTAIKAALEQGIEVSDYRIETKQNLQIK